MGLLSRSWAVRRNAQFVQANIHLNQDAEAVILPSDCLSTVYDLSGTCRLQGIITQFHSIASHIVNTQRLFLIELFERDTMGRGGERGEMRATRPVPGKTVDINERPQLPKSFCPRCRKVLQPRSGATRSLAAVPLSASQGFRCCKIQSSRKTYSFLLGLPEISCKHHLCLQISREGM